MSDRKWTPSQRDAIFAGSRPLLVSAAAGSGKTAVLVERVVRLITDEARPMPADRMLILTFTNAAAAELRARVAARLEAVIREAGPSPHLLRQRMELQRTFVGTIDAFCLQLVREHFGSLNLPPDVAVGDAALLGQLSDKAMRETMEEMYADRDFAAFAALFGRSRSDKPAQEAVHSLYGHVETLPAPGAALKHYEDMYAPGAPLAQTAWGEQLLADAGRALEEAVHLCDAVREAVEREEGLGPYAEAVMVSGQAAAEALAAVDGKAWNRVAAVLRAYDPPALKPAKKCEPALREAVKAQYGKAKDILQGLAKNCFVCTEEEYESDIEAARPLVGALVRAVRLYADKYMAAKLEEKVLDFADFEHLALGLLRDEGGEATHQGARVAGRYDVVMVDEYQDTNELQNALYESLAGKEGGLFLVGDVKQSIYRFRKANPGIFLAKKRAWPPFAGQKGPGVVTLGHNFRSGAGVIGGVNAVFGALMSEQLGDVRYGESERLIQGGEGGDPAGFELCVVNDPVGGGEAQTVANRVAQMVAQGYRVGAGEDERPCGYGDFAVLLRTKGKMAAYVEALEGMGIPVASDANDDLLQSPEVLPVRAALLAIDNPGDQVALTATLLGPLFRFTLDDVSRFRVRAPAGDLWQAVRRSEDPRAVEFVQTILYYRTLATTMPAGRLCEQLVGRSGYLSAAAAMEGGVARRDNILRFIGWANEAAGGGTGSLSALAGLLREGGGPVGSGFRAVEGHVSVLTVHKSKGLEFPICILADTTHRFNTDEMKDRVQMHAELGVGFFLRQGSVLYPTLPLLAIRGRTKSEAASEEMRVLYVALTRAKCKMIALASYPDAAAQLLKKAEEGPATPYGLSRMRSFADWLLSAALADGGAGPLYETASLDAPSFAGVKAAITATVVQAAQLPEHMEEAFRLTAKPDQGLVDRLMEGFARPLPRLALAGIPAKISVSALAKTQTGEETLLRRPSFMYSGGLTAAERGTLQHQFMQYADLRAMTEDLEGEINRLRQQGILEEMLAKSLDRKGLQRFARSALATRMRAADKLRREYDFITSIPAGELDGALEGELARQPVLVQGIADLVMETGGEVEIVDYKTDHGKTAPELAARYHKQLLLYKDAVEKRLQKPVTRLTLWSFALGEEIDLPLAGAPEEPG